MSLQQLQSKYYLSQYIQEELFLMKKNIKQIAQDTNIPNNSACSYLQTSINVKNGFIQLAEGIQARKKLKQIQKSKILSRKIFLEGLKTIKQKLKCKVNQSKTQLIQFDKQIEKPAAIENIVKFPQKEQGHQYNELSVRDKKKQKYEKRLLQKKQLQATIRQNNERYFNLIKQSSQQLCNQLQQRLKLVQFQQYQSSQKIKNKDLASINEKFGASKQQNTIDIVFCNEQFQELQIIIKPSNHQYFILCHANKIALQEKEIKLTIASVAPHYNSLVVGIDQALGLTNKDVFDYLYNNEVVKAISKNLNNPIMSAINSKYVQLDWINELLLNETMSVKYFLNLIKQRVFCLRLMQYLSKNIKTMDFFFPRQCNLKDITQRTLEQITCQQYLQLVHKPSWINKQLSLYNPVLLQIQEMKDSLPFCKKKRNQLLNFLTILNFEELLQKDINFYYKGTFSIVQKVLTYILIVPKTYPTTHSRINIVKWQNSLKNEDCSVNIDLPCAFKYSSRNTPISDKILAIQQEVNEKITKCIKELHKHFRILVQLNRLLILLGQTENLYERY